MPQETGYRSQIGPAAPAALPQASPSAFGANVGAAVAQVGESLQRRELQAIAIERDQRRGDEWADFNARFAALRLEADVHETDLRASMPPGGKGYTEARAKWMEERAAAMLEGITEDSVRRQAQAQLSDYGARLGSQAYAVETGARIAKRTTDFQQRIDIARNRVQRDPANFRDEREMFLIDIEGMDDVPADVREKLKVMGEAGLSLAMLSGVTAANPEAALEMLASPAFDGLLTPEQIDGAKRSAAVELRRRNAEAAATIAAEKSEARQDIDLLQRRIATGVPVDDAELEAAQALASKYDLKLDAFDLSRARVENETNRVYENATPVQLDTEVKRLEALRAKQGDKFGVADQVRLTRLTSMLSDRSAELKRDPWNAASRAGVQFAPLDMSDPASIAARRQAVGKAQARGIDVPFLSDEEAAGWTAEAGKGPEGRMAVLEKVRAIGGARAIGAAAEQVMPGDRIFARAAVLPPVYARLAMQGGRAMEATKGMVPPSDTWETYRDHVRGAFNSLGPDFVNGTKETADAIYAGLLVRNGAAGQEFDKAIYARAIDMAVSATAKGGGVGEYGGRKVLLPTGMDQGEFNRRMSADGAKLRAAGTDGGPVARDGSPIYADVLRKQFRPVAIGDGQYRFENSSGQVLTVRGGRPWIVDMWKVRP